MTQVAMDVHKNHSTLTALNPSTGEIVVRKFLTDRNDLARKLADLPRPLMVAVESSRHSPAMCRWLQAMGAQVRLGNAAELARHTKAKASNTDEKDAEVMLRLMHLDELPECYLASEEVVQLRDLSRVARPQRAGGDQREPAKPVAQHAGARGSAGGLL